MYIHVRVHYTYMNIHKHIYNIHLHFIETEDKPLGIVDGQHRVGSLQVNVHPIRGVYCCHVPVNLLSVSMLWICWSMLSICWHPLVRYSCELLWISSHRMLSIYVRLTVL
jgi:hypothetical protein